MYKNGIKKNIEIGASNVLQGLVKRIITDENIEIIGLEKIDDVSL